MNADTPMTFAEVNGTVIHYIEMAHEHALDRPALLLSNSLGTEFRIWNTVAERLRKDWRIIAYDKRGHGLSPATPQPYSVDDHVFDALELIDHLGVDRFIPIGISMGGLVAQGLWKHVPERVVAMVLSNTGHIIGNADMWNARIKAALDGGLEPMTDAVMEKWFSLSYRESNPVAMAGWGAMLCRTSPHGYAGTCAALRDTDYTELAKTISVPALCVSGEHDKATPPELVKELASLIPGAEHQQIAGSGHLPAIDNPKAYTDVIEDFLNRVIGVSE